MTSLGAEIKSRTNRMMGGAASTQYLPAYKGDKDRRRLSAESKQALVVGGIGLALFIFGMFALSSFFAAEHRGQIPLHMHKEAGDHRAPQEGNFSEYGHEHEHDHYDPHHHCKEATSSIHHDDDHNKRVCIVL